MCSKTITSEILYADYHDKVSRYVSGKVSNPYDAEDLISSVFVKVCQKLDTFDESRSSVSTWIYNITKNTVIDYYRTRKVITEIPEDLCSTGSVDDKLVNEETLEQLYVSLKQLDERARDIIILHYYSGITLKEISVRMNMSYSNIKIVHNKALNTLNKKMCSVYNTSYKKV